MYFRDIASLLEMALHHLNHPVNSSNCNYLLLNVATPSHYPRAMPYQAGFPEEFFWVLLGTIFAVHKPFLLPKLQHKIVVYIL